MTNGKDTRSGESMRELMDRLAAAAGADSWSDWDGSIEDLPVEQQGRVAEAFDLIEAAVVAPSSTSDKIGEATMEGLILLYIDEQEPVRCVSLDDAKTKIEAHGPYNDKAFIKWTPEGGGPVSALEYSPNDGSWVAYQS